MRLLDYNLSYNRRAQSVGGLRLSISHRAGDANDAPPVHIVSVAQDLGQSAPSQRLSPHTQVQEFLNRTEALWGIVTNGTTLRLLRDSTYIRRQAYVEFDLPALFDEQRFEDFDALYRILHRSRLPEGAADAAGSYIEKYYQHGVEQGGRVRDRLRDGVEQAILTLGNGFLSQQQNRLLIRRVGADDSALRPVSAWDMYRHLLILVYRLLFLLVAEDRGVLRGSPLYYRHYGVGRLRDRLDRNTDKDHHDDVWRSLQVLWRLLGGEAHRRDLGRRPLADLLGLPVLNGDLFKPGLFDKCTISNAALMEAFDSIARYDEDRGPRRRVNYAALDVEELGSVYESLLDFRPSIESTAGGRLRFTLHPGSKRKSTGSYYTPPSLVAELIKSALEPVVQMRLEGCKTVKDQVRAIKSLRVCDPACGSGHFLLAAARHLGKRLASIRTGEGEPAPESVRSAIRDVVAHSIYGVDSNPLAVDLCRVALWIESHVPKKPLTFLDHRIRCGNSLLGVFDLAVLSEGVPDQAFDPVKGDCKATARFLKRQNKKERRDRETGQAHLRFETDELTDLTDWARKLDSIEDDSLAAIRFKQSLYEEWKENDAYGQKAYACHLFSSAFFQRFEPQTQLHAVTSETLFRHLDGDELSIAEIETTREVAKQYQFFHWKLEFPEVFDEQQSIHGCGFDAVLGNPPWEKITLKDTEFFSGRDESIVSARNAASRKRAIEMLATTNPKLHQEYNEAVWASVRYGRFLRKSGRFPLCGRGDINLYSVFAETMRSLLNDRGRLGCLLDSGIATADTTKVFFQDIVETNSLVSLYDFENKGLFPAVDSRQKFCLFTCSSAGSSKTIRFVFFAHHVKDITESHRLIDLSPNDIALLNPNTRTCPIFRSSKDAELTKEIYRRVPVFAIHSSEIALSLSLQRFLESSSQAHTPGNPWGVQFATMFHMANDSQLFRSREELEHAGWRLCQSPEDKATLTHHGLSDSTE